MGQNQVVRLFASLPARQLCTVTVGENVFMCQTMSFIFRKLKRTIIKYRELI